MYRLLLKGRMPISINDLYKIFWNGYFNGFVEVYFLFLLFKNKETRTLKQLYILLKLLLWLNLSLHWASSTFIRTKLFGEWPPFTCPLRFKWTPQFIITSWRCGHFGCWCRCGCGSCGCNLSITASTLLMDTWCRTAGWMFPIPTVWFAPSVSNQTTGPSGAGMCRYKW